MAGSFFARARKAPRFQRENRWNGGSWRGVENRFCAMKLMTDPINCRICSGVPASLDVSRRGQWHLPMRRPLPAYSTWLILLALALLQSARAATLTSGYSIGSELLGGSTIIDNAATGAAIGGVNPNFRMTLAGTVFSPEHLPAARQPCETSGQQLVHHR